MRKKANTNSRNNQLLSKPYNIFIIILLLGFAGLLFWPNIIREDVGNGCVWTKDGVGSTDAAGKIEARIVPNVMTDSYIKQAQDKNKCIHSKELVGTGKQILIKSL